MKLHRLFQDCTSSGRGAETKLFKFQQIDTINVKKHSRRDSCAKPMSPKGGKLGICDLEDISGPPAKPPKVSLKLDTWLRVLNLTSWGSKSQLQF